MATATKAKPTTRPVPTGKLIDQYWAAREEKRRLEAEVKEVETVMADLEQKLMESMESEGLEKATGTKASVSISTSTVADVKDWDSFWAYIFKNKYSHLLQRRVSEPAYRELLEAGKKVPGVEPFNKRKLNLRSL
jgi:hypothetical protein